MDTSKLQIIKQRYNVVGNCDALNRALDVALQVAPTDLSVLIIGESGVGKEIIPRVIHDNSPRKREKYFAINCGSIPEGTIDSELFGHEKGSYLGAMGGRPPCSTLAPYATLFLDEVGELPMATQARLLRVLETGEYIRVGGQEIRKTNVRIVAATNVNMRKAISEGKFREDLYYRLNTIPINMPPLRERGNDILLLFRLFAMQMAEKYKLPKITLDDEAKQVMLKYKWPGNVRQLKNITEQMSVIAEKRVIDREEILRFIPQDTESTELALVDKGQGSHSYESEREILYKILYELRGNVSDLRRDLNNVRKQLETYRELEETAHYRHLATEGAQTLPATTQDAFRPDDKEVEDAVAEEIQETRPQREEESLNLNDNQRQMVVRALERNNGNRKKAAQELGISDRTLYRRIKEYGLEDK